MRHAWSQHLSTWRGAARAALGISLATLLALPASAQSSEESVGQATFELKGRVITGYTGVVDYFYLGPSFVNDQGQTMRYRSDCTGSMIAPDVILSAGHCLDELRERQAPATWTFVIHYYFPDQGRLEVYTGPATWHVFPGFDGLNTASAGEANDDLAVIQVPHRFADTNYRDYLRIYAGDGDILEDRGVHMFGAGYHTHSGNEDDQLRTEWFEVENAERNHIVVDNRSKATVCRGDSGGPFIALLTAAGVRLPTIAGVASSVEAFEGDAEVCANNDLYDDAYAARPHERKMHIFQRMTGLTCSRQSGAERPYLRCFDLPMIENVKSEGLDQGKATAMAVSSVM